jgi:hypothetical protein
VETISSASLSKFRHGREGGKPSKLQDSLDEQFLAAMHAYHNASLLLLAWVAACAAMTGGEGSANCLHSRCAIE